MDTMSAFARGQAALLAGAEMRVFDWDRAARIIRDRGAQAASAGLEADWEFTGGPILSEAQPLAENDGCYLASIWAKPQLEIDGEIIDCWRYQEETPGWDSSTFWPESAVAILTGTV